jgi:hypothetical protein
VGLTAGQRPWNSRTDAKEAMTMYESSTSGDRTAPAGARTQIIRRRRIRKDLPELDLRTPSGKRTLPY